MNDRSMEPNIAKPHVLWAAIALVGAAALIHTAGDNPENSPSTYYVHVVEGDPKIVMTELRLPIALKAEFQHVRLTADAGRFKNPQDWVSATCERFSKTHGGAEYPGCENLLQSLDRSHG